jgi:predicted RNA-binding Zn ribbon-like protein
MPRSVAEETPTLEFRYVGGDACVDFVNTVDWTSRGLVDERLSSYERLTEWARGAELLTAGAATAFRAAAAARPRDAAAALRAAHELREALQRVLASAATGDRRFTGAEEFNARLAEVLEHLKVAPSGAGEDEAPARWGWRGWEGRLDSVLWPVAWRAALLLTGPDGARLRVCAGPDCGWMFVDRSRNGLRRWCEMETCGTRAKSRRRASRTREQGR